MSTDINKKTQPFIREIFLFRLVEKNLPIKNCVYSNGATSMKLKLKQGPGLNENEDKKE